VFDNIVYIAGGETAASASNQLLALDLNNTGEGWKQLPVIPKPVSHSVLTVQSNGNNTCIYLIGGRKKSNTGISDLYNSVFEFNLMKNQWEEKRPLPYSLCAGIGIATNSNDILLFGGDKGTTFHKVEILIAAINAEKDETKKQELVLQKNKLQAEHPGFSREILLYNTLTDSWKLVGDIPFDTPVTTIAVKWGNDVIIPSGEIKAGVRSPKILSVKILQKAK
jgi:N-acetylneuraminate epimerase